MWRSAVLMVVLILTASSSMAQEQVDDFFYLENRDEMTDEKRDSLITPAKDNGSIVLGWKCMSDGLNFILLMDDPLIKLQLLSVESDTPSIQYRFDDNEPIGPNQRWQYQSRNGVLFAPMNRIDQITEKARQSVELKIRIWAPDGTPVDTWTFSMMGAMDGLNRLPCYPQEEHVDQQSSPPTQPEEGQAAGERAEQTREQRLAELRGQYVASIKRVVQNNWRQPAEFREGDIAEVEVTQIPSGDVTKVALLSCTGGSAFCESVVAAVERSSPLPQAPTSEVFRRNLQFTFRPRNR